MSLKIRGNISLFLLLVGVFALILSIHQWQKFSRQKSNSSEEVVVGEFNVILISVDALRPDHLGVYGYPKNTSPFIDELSKESVVFLDVLSQVPSTRYSHQSLFTSKYLLNPEGDYSTSLTLAEYLRGNGYKTAAFTSGGFMSKVFGLDKGFDLYEDRYSAPSNVGKIGLKSINPKVIKWLSENQKQRFFLFIHTYDVHWPYCPPDPYFHMFIDSYKNSSIFASKDFYSKCGKIDYNKLTLSANDVNYVKAFYDGGIRYTDDMLRNLFKEIEKLGLYNNTIIVITADHGEGMGERGHFGHGQLFDEQLRIPLIMRIPNYKHQIVKEPVQSIDIFPTILGLLNLTVPKNLDGFDLRPIIDGSFSFNDSRLRISVTRRLLISKEEYENPIGQIVAVRVNNTWNLIIYDDGKNELYNLDSDKIESKNVIIENRDIANFLLAKYLEMNSTNL
jgi:arylsulfatase A-like enzyme